MRKIKILWRARIERVWFCGIEWGQDQKRNAILCGVKRLRKDGVRFSVTLKKPHTLLIVWYQPYSPFTPENSLRIMGYSRKNYIIR